jgi:hypothetical protein
VFLLVCREGLGEQGEGQGGLDRARARTGGEVRPRCCADGELGRRSSGNGKLCGRCLRQARAGRERERGKARGGREGARTGPIYREEERERVGGSNGTGVHQPPIMAASMGRERGGVGERRGKRSTVSGARRGAVGLARRARPACRWRWHQPNFLFLSPFCVKNFQLDPQKT